MKKLCVLLIVLFASMAMADGLVISTGGAPDTSNDAYDAQIRFGSNVQTGTSFKICLISDAGSILAVSNVGTFAASTTVTVTFPSTYTLVATTAYRAGLIGNGYFDMGVSGGSWDLNIDATNSYATPQAVSPATDTNDAGGLIAIAIRNSVGTVLLGSTGGAGSVTASGADTMAYWGTAETY